MSPPRPSILERHGGLMARRRWIVIPLVLALLVGAVMLSGRIGDVATDEQTARQRGRPRHRADRDAVLRRS